MFNQKNNDFKKKINFLSAMLSLFLMNGGLFHPDSDKEVNMTKSSIIK